ncbi:hypothetical protein [Nocardioides sp. PD653]|uniref:hypothetical protein n=1 Tax=Nocardioides sp. PD653 TaxID=393303 RepID=UPI0009F09528|nr:hypothetical protein [Nocardioides sp. PD653]GAW54754.1 uncharacterized protein (Precursor) [Nocardioides sp. PD653]
MNTRWLPWRRRTASAERGLQEARRKLYRVHEDWTPLAEGLARIDQEIRLNDWTITAKRIFAGRGQG